MVLLDDVVEILHLSNNDWDFAADIDLIHGRLVGAALVHGDPCNNAAVAALGRRAGL